MTAGPPLAGPVTQQACSQGLANDPAPLGPTDPRQLRIVSVRGRGYPKRPTASPPIPMLFRRKKDSRPTRTHYRADLTDAEAILATIISPSGLAPEGVISDLSIHGAGVLIPFESDPALAVGDVVELILRSPVQGWTVQTPIRLCQVRQEGPRDVLYGGEFINMGNLYSQLENALGAYFNRRVNVRVRPEVSHKVIAQVRAGARRVRSPVHDLSVTGLGISVHRYQKDWIREGQLLDVSFPLPGVKKELSGPAYVRHFDPLTANLLVGLEFDLDDPKGITRHMKKLEAYIEERAGAIELFGQEWARESGDTRVAAPASDLLAPPPPGNW